MMHTISFSARGKEGKTIKSDSGRRSAGGAHAQMGGTAH